MNTQDTVATWPALQPGQARWLGEWVDSADMSHRHFVGRHEQGAIFGGEAVATSEVASIGTAPWWTGLGWIYATDRDAAKRQAEQFVAEMFGFGVLRVGGAA